MLYIKGLLTILISTQLCLFFYDGYPWVEQSIYNVFLEVLLVIIAIGLFFYGFNSLYQFIEQQKNDLYKTLLALPALMLFGLVGYTLPALVLLSKILK